MLKRGLAYGLVAIALNLACMVPVSIGQQTKVQDKAVQKNVKYIKRLKKWAKDDPVTIKLQDGTIVKGYLTEATDDHFALTDRKTGQSTTLNYEQVKDIREGMGTKTKIGVAIGLGVLAIFAVCAISHGCEER